MRINSLSLLAAIVVLLVVSISCVSAYENTLTWNSSEDQLHAVSSWASTGTSMYYKVTQDVSTGIWLYEYMLTIGDNHQISHLIIETSKDFTCKDVIDYGYTQGSFSSIEVGDLKAGSGNPGMPEDIHGIKFDSASGTILSVWLETYRAPVWGDFYSKDGGTRAVFNTGFTVNDTDPSSPYTAIVSDHILRPDTVVPEPSSILVLCSGLATVIGGIKLRRTK